MKVSITALQMLNCSRSWQLQTVCGFQCMKHLEMACLATSKAPCQNDHVVRMYSSLREYFSSQTMVLRLVANASDSETSSGIINSKE